MRRRSGVVLLEVLIALVILATAGLALAAHSRQSVEAIARVRNADRQLQAADRFFSAVSLWSRTELEQRLGEHRQGPWLLTVALPEPALFDVALSDSLGRGVIVRTRLHRPTGAASAP